MEAAADIKTVSVQEAFQSIVADFGKAYSEQEIVAILRSFLINEFGALDVSVVVKQGSRLPYNLQSKKSEAVSSKTGMPLDVVEATAEADALFLQNSPVVLLPSEAEAYGLPLPLETDTAVLTHAAVVGSTIAMCVCWGKGRKPTGTEFDGIMQMVANMVGLALERTDAIARAKHFEADFEHRIRNFLSFVRSMGRRSAKRALSVQDFLDHFEGRLDALGRTHTFLNQGGAVSFELVLREELLAQQISDGPRVRIEGEDVAIASLEAETLGLTIHELAVNAVKYGAQSHEGGDLAIRWQTEPAKDRQPRTLHLDWKETLPFEIETTPKHTGFGRTVIESLLAYQLNAKAVLTFMPKAVSCQISVPLSDNTDGSQ